MEFTQSEILARLKSGLKNGDSRIEGSFSMDNLQAVSEELARIAQMQVQPLWNEMEKNIAETITAGNERYYEFLAMQTEDADGQKLVGNARAHGVRDGSGLINISIITPETEVPPAGTVQLVTDYINEQRLVGAKPVVSVGKMIEVTVSGTVQLQEGADITVIRSQVQSDIREYLRELSMSDEETTTLNYYRVGIIISAIAGVSEVTDYRVNDGMESITADFSQFFSLKGLVLNVSS